MSRTADIANTDRVNYLNIGLMAVAGVLAVFLPFHLFLFSYAVLGPGHYLTEISWLHERRFFTKGRRDHWPLVAFAILVFVVGYATTDLVAREHRIRALGALCALAFGSALVFVLTQRLVPRIIGLSIVAVGALLAMDMQALFVVFLPTLIHVYVFTGFFILYGALKGHSRSGYASFVAFLACSLIVVAARYEIPRLGNSIVIPYSANFAVVNRHVLGIAEPVTHAQALDAAVAVYVSPAGLAVQRFIAFAYTYHYLNWFSKLPIIRWHAVPKRRLGVIAVLWLASLVAYAYDFQLGFRLLFCLSFMHVTLEFPLNHLTILGTFREIGTRLRLTPASA